LLAVVSVQVWQWAVSPLPEWALLWVIPCILPSRAAAGSQPTAELVQLEPISSFTSRPSGTV